MITKERFENLKSGDILIFQNKVRPNRSRLVINKPINNSIRLRMAYFKSNTVYTYSDIYKKVIGVLKLKNQLINN